MSLFNDLLSFYQRKILPGLKLTKNELVIDIGCGDKPFYRADVFFDNLALADNQRNTNSPIMADLGLFINGDITKKTIFPHHFFDFSFCAHLLEHVDDPAAAIKEIMRISKSGYLEVPNGSNEALSPFISHLWSVYLDDDTLVFVRKTKTDQQIWAANYESFHKNINFLKKPFICYFWKKEIKYRIIDCQPKERYWPPDQKFAKVKNPVKQKIFHFCLRFLRTCLYHQHANQQKILPLKKIYEKTTN